MSDFPTISYTWTSDILRDGTLENLWGGGGRAKYKKKVLAQGKIKWKKFVHANNGLLKKQEPITWRQLILKKYSCYGLKKFIQGIWYRKIIPAAWKFPSSLPPHNFSNGQSLSLACRTESSRIDIKGCPPPRGVCEDDLSVNQALRHEE